MNEPTFRYEPSQGVAFDEAGDMQRLSTLAAEGWRLNFVGHCVGG